MKMKRKTFIDMIKEALTTLGGEQKYPQILDEVIRLNPDPPSEIKPQSIAALMKIGADRGHWVRVKHGLYRARTVQAVAEPDAHAAVASASA